MKKTIAEINEIRDRMRAEIITRENTDITRVVVGMATCGLSAGAKPVYETLCEEVKARGLNKVEVTMAGCLGMCKLEPIVEIYIPKQDKITYIHMNAEKAKNVVESHLVGGKVVEDYLINE